MDSTTLCTENQEAAAPSTPFASKMQSLYEVCQLHCSTKIFPSGLFNWWSGTPGDPLCWRAWRGVMGHGSLLLAIAHQKFPRRVGSYLPHSAL